MDHGTMEYDDTIVTQADLEDLAGEGQLRDCVVVNLLTHFVEVARNYRRPVKAAFLAPDVSNSIYLTVVARQSEPRKSAELGPADLALPRMFGGDDYDYLLMPLHMMLGSNGHWMLAILHRQSSCVTFFDPLQPRDDVPSVRRIIADLIEGVVAAIYGRDFLALGVEIQVADYETFTKQTDGYNCGVHVCLIAEYFLKGVDDFRVDSLNLSQERLRYHQLLSVARPRLTPTSGHNTFPRHAHSVHVPRESTDATTRACATKRTRATDDDDTAPGSVTESTKRGKPRPNKRSPIMKYFEQTNAGMKCPACKGILTARNNQFNAANLEQHLAKHSESDEYKRFVAEKAEWRAREPRKSLAKQINPLTDRKRRSPVADDAEREERKRVSTRASVVRTRERLRLEQENVKRLKLDYYNGGQTCMQILPVQQADSRITSIVGPSCVDEGAANAGFVQCTAASAPSQAKCVAVAWQQNADYASALDQCLSQTCANLYAGPNTYVEYGTTVHIHPNTLRIFDDAGTLAMNYVIGTFERLYRSDSATTSIDWFDTYLPDDEDSSIQQERLLTAHEYFMETEDWEYYNVTHERLDTSSSLTLVGLPTVREFQFLVAVVRSGPIWPLINSVRRRLLHTPDSAYLGRLYGILGSVIVHFAAVEIFSLDVVDMSRRASQFFFTELNQYFTVLRKSIVRSKEDLTSILERLEQSCFNPDDNTDDDTIRDVLSTNEAVYHRHLFYEQCYERSPRISTALRRSFALVPRQAAETCHLRKYDAFVETWQTITREDVWNEPLIRFKADFNPTKFESVSFQNLAYYAIANCFLTFRGYRPFADRTRVRKGLDYRDITKPSFIEGIKQLRAKSLSFRNFSKSPLSCTKEITSLKWCLSHAQYISNLVFEFTQVEQLLICLNDLLNGDYPFPRGVTDVTLNCEPFDLCNIGIDLFLMSISRFVHSIAHQDGRTLDDFKTHSFLEAVRLLFEVSNRYRDQLPEFEQVDLEYFLRSEDITKMYANVRGEQPKTRNYSVVPEFDHIKQFMDELKSSTSNRRSFTGEMSDPTLQHSQESWLSIHFSNIEEFGGKLRGNYGVRVYYHVASQNREPVSGAVTRT